MITVTRLRAADVDQFWPLFAEGMHRSCVKSGGQLSAGYLWQECRADRAFLYVVHEDNDILGAAVFAFREWPSGVRYQGFGLCGKDATRWFDTLHEQAKIDGRMGGAVAMIDAPRPGLGRKYYKGRPGIKVIQVVYEERL